MRVSLLFLYLSLFLSLSILAILPSPFLLAETSHYGPQENLPCPSNHRWKRRLRPLFSLVLRVLWNDSCLLPSHCQFIGLITTSWRDATLTISPDPRPAEKIQAPSHTATHWERFNLSDYYINRRKAICPATRNYRSSPTSAHVLSREFSRTFNSFKCPIMALVFFTHNMQIYIIIARGRNNQNFNV